MKSVGVLLGKVIFGFVALQIVAFAADEPFKPIRLEGNEWLIEYTPADHPFTTIILDGKSHIRFTEPTSPIGNDLTTGVPGLPADAFSLGVPDGADLTAEIESAEYDLIENTNVAPSPSYDITIENEAVEKFTRSAPAYATNSFVPEMQIEVERPVNLRHQRIVTVRVRPYQYNPLQQALRKISRAKILLHVRGKFSAAAEAQKSDPHFEETYRSLLLNYEQARHWRFTPMLAPQVDSSAIWFEPGKKYLKIGIAEDGWYKVTRAQMLSTGFDLLGASLSSLKVSQRGYQIPIVVGADTSIQFFARRNYGDSTYIDFFTDTSACWLTSGGEDGLRFSIAEVNSAPTVNITSATRILHVEQNKDYFYSSSNSESVDNTDVPGEGWYWFGLSVNAESSQPFSLDSVDRTSTSATVRARLWGTNYVAPLGTPYLHKARVWVNDSLAGDFVFAQRTGGVFSATIPSTWLKVGNNVFKVRSLDTGTGGGTFYVDWFEIDYSRKLRATNNQLCFTVPSSPPGAIKRFTVAGFTGPDIEIFDLTGNRKLTPALVTGDSSSGFSVEFLDSVSSVRTYVAINKNNPRNSFSFVSKMFANIRQVSSGADYIIITHKDFRGQAEQLAAHRRAFNGVRSIVVDVDDIYDEFNFGVKNGARIKSFLQFAKNNWTAPSPSYLLFLGDASFDSRFYWSNTYKKDFVPTHGFPGGDNWYACFDTATSFLPSMYVGRIPAETPAIAQAVVNKLVAHDNSILGDWTKTFLYITGGVSATEQTGFNYLADNSIASYVAPAPLGGTPIRVYKSTSGIVDGDYKQTLMGIFKNGVNFVSFTGHSGGRVWSVDPGKPSEWENTNGRWPFIAAVSCNIGGYWAPANRVMAEDFLDAENRGAIAAWASASLGYATYGAALTNYLLSNVMVDSVREFGKLTTNARYRLWFETGSGYITVAMVNLNPLIGDPLSSFALPKKPDIAVSPPDFSFAKTNPTQADTVVTARILLHNYGLVPKDTVNVSVTSIHDGATTYLLNNVKLRKIMHRDSVVFPLRSSTLGLHTITTSVDPLNKIAEVNKLNNIASVDRTIFTNNLFVVKPLDNTLVSPGTQTLVVTSPIGYDEEGFAYQFELDTVDTFDSPWLQVSGAVVPGLVKGEWLTPTLQSGKTYFWRARTLHGTLAGNWVVSSFHVSDEVTRLTNATEQEVYWRQQSREQFNRNILTDLTPTDSGVTITPRPAVHLFCRSVGSLYNSNQDYYATIIANDQVGSGYWWPIGRSFVAARISDITGAMDYRAFPLYAAYGATNAGPWQADSMANFITSTPVGNYIAVATIFDGQTNVNEHLRLAMDSLGATRFRSILNGQTYAFIGRKGSGVPGMVPLEQLRTNDSCVVSFAIPCYYGAGSGSMITASIPIAASWDSLTWRRTITVSRSDATVALLGLRSDGSMDTLRKIPADSTGVDLGLFKSLTNNPRYSALRLGMILKTNDATVTPVLTDWSLSFAPPPDLAVSAQTVGTTQADAMNFSLPVTVHNIGYMKSDSSRVIINAIDKYNQSRQLTWAFLDSIPIDGNRTLSMTFSTSGLATRTRLQVAVSPLHKSRDLISENNTAYYQLTLNRAVPAIQMRVLVNGSEILDGDFIPPNPHIQLVPDQNAENVAVQSADLLVDNKWAQQSVVSMRPGNGRESSLDFFPVLGTGSHELKFALATLNDQGEIDSVENVIRVNVEAEAGLKHVVNFPNPFNRETYFNFVLTGSAIPTEVKVKIFTVAGRKIKEISVRSDALRIGANRVFWDGRDSDGDEIANGYYLYQITANSGGTLYSSTEKLVKIR